jgi:tetratricopeptide (TPR) repeat protein
MNRLIFLSLCSLILFLIVPNQEVNAQQYEYGKVDFGVSCSETVQADFDRAMAMLHNMMYATAREDFKEIAETKPNCAMAHWGIATTLFQPLWGTRPGKEDLQQGWDLMEKARDLVDSDREEYLIESTAEFFREPESAEFWTRIQRWADAMEAAYEAYPDDADVAALYGLSRLAIAQTAEDRDPLHDEAEEVLRNVYEQIPSHPGAIHYSIHATDVDGRAENALDMVEAYGKIAPDVPHALHMPTHIYVRLGDWDEVINWNQRSAEAALNHPVNGATSHHYVHAIDYLIYAYLQLGEDDKIEPLLKEVRDNEPHQASTVATFHHAAMQARLAVETRDWEKALKLEPRTPEYLPWNEFPWAEGLTWLAKGLGAVHNGDMNTANEAKQKLKELRDGAKASGAGDMATYIEIDRLILVGQIAHAEGNEKKAVELIKSAAELESSTEKHPVTPGALLPPNEALGDLLMELDRPAEALQAYEASNETWPERYNTLLGAARAAKAAENMSAAQNYYEKLLANVGDSERTSISEAKDFIAKQ